MIQQWFKTVGSWAITGLSMGGYGALKLAFDRPDLFRSSVSHSGALHFGHFEPKEENDFTAEFRPILGSNIVGGPNDLYALVEKLSPDERPAMRIDCGADDFLIEANRDFHRFLLEQGIARLPIGRTFVGEMEMLEVTLKVLLHARQTAEPRRSLPQA